MKPALIDSRFSRQHKFDNLGFDREAKGLAVKAIYVAQFWSPAIVEMDFRDVAAVAGQQPRVDQMPPYRFDIQLGTMVSLGTKLSVKPGEVAFGPNSSIHQFFGARGRSPVLADRWPGNWNNTNR